MGIDEKSAIWNRAALDELNPDARPGDLALRDLLLAHSMIQNGGVAHCVEALSVQELDQAVGGYRFFGLDAAADVLLHAMTLGDPEQTLMDARFDSIFDELDVRYARVVPDDQLLADRFEKHLESAPEDFAEVSP